MAGSEDSQAYSLSCQLLKNASFADLRGSLCKHRLPLLFSFSQELTEGIRGVLWNYTHFLNWGGGGRLVRQVTMLDVRFLSCTTGSRSPALLMPRESRASGQAATQKQLLPKPGAPESACLGPGHLLVPCWKCALREAHEAAQQCLGSPRLQLLPASWSHCPLPEVSLL